MGLEEEEGQAMSDYLKKSADSDLSKMFVIILVLIGVTVVVSFASGYWICHISHPHTHTEPTK